MKVLVSAPYLLPYMDEYRPVIEQYGVDVVVADVEERLEEDALLEIISDIDGVIAGDDRFTRKVLENAPKLKVLSKWGTGIDSFDQDAAKELGIQVRNVPNAFSEPVADSVLGYMLAFGRNLAGMDRAMKAGTWQKIPGRALNESTVGVIGIGNVGKAVVRRLQGFGCRVLGNDIRTLDPEETKGFAIELVSLDDLLAESDFVSVNCDLNPTSRHLLSDREFARMKSSSYLVNCARGPIIDQKALIRALQNEEIAGVAMDVFEHEPIELDSPLLGMDNIFLAPHNSNSSATAWRRTHAAAIRNVLIGMGVIAEQDELVGVKS